MRKTVSTFSAVSIFLVAALLFAGCLNVKNLSGTTGLSPSPSQPPSLSPSPTVSQPPTVSELPSEEPPPSPPKEGGEEPPAAPS